MLSKYHRKIVDHQLSLFFRVCALIKLLVEFAVVCVRFRDLYFRQLLLSKRASQNLSGLKVFGAEVFSSVPVPATIRASHSLINNWQ